MLGFDGGFGLADRFVEAGADFLAYPVVQSQVSILLLLLDLFNLLHQIIPPLIRLLQIV